MFNSTIKQTHRAAVLELHRNCPLRRPILYLDDECAGATRFFRDHGVPNKCLVPVNLCKDACASIYAETGVRAVHARIQDHLVASSVEYSVVWLDLQSHTVDKACMKDAFRWSPFVVLTLSLRGKRHAEMVNLATKSIVAGGGAVLESTLYKGVSHIANMCKVIAQRKAAPVTHVAKKVTHVAKAWKPDKYIGKTLHIPCTDWKEGTQCMRHVKTADKHFVFRVDCTYYGKRLAVRAIDKRTNRPYNVKEPWTLAVKDARRFCRDA